MHICTPADWEAVTFYLLQPNLLYHNITNKSTGIAKLNEKKLNEKKLNEKKLNKKKLNEKPFKILVLGMRQPI